MKAFEFQTKLHSSNTIDIPEGYQLEFKPEQDVRVIVLIDEASEGDSWKRLTTKHFFAGYSDEDAIYDNLK